MPRYQSIKCKGCGAILAAKAEPSCYSDPDWIKERDRITKKRNVTVGTIPAEQYSISECSCKSDNTEAGSLFG